MYQQFQKNLIFSADGKNHRLVGAVTWEEVVDDHRLPQAVHAEPASKIKFQKIIFNFNHFKKFLIKMIKIK